MSGVQRFEVINHTSTGEGRELVKYFSKPIQVILDYQDEGRTVKVFLRDEGSFPDEIKDSQ